MDALTIGAEVLRVIEEETGLDSMGKWAQEGEMRRVEELGFRVGYTDGPLRGRGSWIITDLRTGQIAARGEGPDSLEAEWNNGRWWMIDQDIGFEHLDRKNSGSLPDVLWNILREWVWENPEEAKELARK